MDGYWDSDGYCYFTPTNCSTYYTGCQCFLTYSTSYTNATCANINGLYTNGRCYYNSGPRAGSGAVSK